MDPVTQLSLVDEERHGFVTCTLIVIWMSVKGNLEMLVCSTVAHEVSQIINASL